MNNSRSYDTHAITGVGIFMAIVIVLQLLGAFIKFGPFSISLTLIPIVVGAAIYGPGAGAWLGFVFSMVVLLSGDAGPFLAVNAFGTVLTVTVAVRGLRTIRSVTSPATCNVCSEGTKPSASTVSV